MISDFRFQIYSLINRTSKIENLKCSKGFTLIEILLVIGLGIMLIAAAIPIYSNLQVSSQLNESSAQCAQTIRLARTRSAARLHNSSHGVFFDINPTGSDRYVLFEGSSYASRNQSYDRIIILDSAIALSASLRGSAEIVFSPSFGLPSATGTIIMGHSASGDRTISINAAGAVDYE